MSKNKRVTLCFLLLLLTLLCACSAGPAQSGEAKILLEPPQGDQAVKYKTVVAEKQDYAQRSGADAALYPVGHAVRLKADKMRFAKMHVRNGDYVEEGALIASFTKDADNIRLEEIRLEIKRLQSSKEDGLYDYERAVNELYEQMQTTILPEQAAVLEKRLRILELDREISDLRIDQQIKTLKREREQLEAREQAEEVLAPMSGIVANVAYLRDGVLCPNGTLLCTLYRPEECLFAINNSMNRMRMGMRVTLEYGKKNDRHTATGRIVSAANCLPSSLGSDRAYLLLDEGSLNEAVNNVSDAVMNSTSMLNPNTILSPTVDAEVLTLKDALLLPRSALENEGGKYSVTILENDTLHKRYVEIATTTLDSAWILSGVSEGQTVVIR